MATIPDTEEISNWLRRLGFPAAGLELLTGDVSPRRYLRARLQDGSTAIVAAYPRNLISGCRRFAATTSLLESGGVRVPAILADDCAAGLMLVEDLGQPTLFEHADQGWKALEPWLQNAAALACEIQKLPEEPVARLNPPLDAPSLQTELTQTWHLFLRPRRLVGSGSISAALASSLEHLCANLAQPPLVVCHRDLMARNLVPIAPKPELAVLDHQDLRLGPLFYDLASLLNDSLFPPPEIEARVLAPYLQTPDDRLAYQRATAQRALKAIGTYAAFAKRGSDRHLSLVEPTWARARRHLETVPETAEVAAELAEAWQAFSETCRHRI